MDSADGPVEGNQIQPSKPSLARCLFAFLVCGPILGWLVFLIIGLVGALMQPDDEVFWWTAPAFLALSIFLSAIGIPLAFLIGAVPAGITGLIYWIARSRMYLSISVSMIASMISAGGTGTAFGLMLEGEGGGDAPDLWPLAPIFGFIVTPVCVFIAERKFRATLRAAKVDPAAS